MPRPSVNKLHAILESSSDLSNYLENFEAKRDDFKKNPEFVHTNFLLGKLIDYFNARNRDFYFFRSLNHSSDFHHRFFRQDHAEF